MGGGVRIVDDNAIKVSGGAFKVCYDLVDYLDEPAGGDTAALRRDEPLKRSIRCAEGGEGNGILVDGNLVEGGDEVAQGKYASVAQGSNDLVNAGDGGLSEGPDGVQLLVVDGDADASILPGNGYHWAGVWRSGMPDEAGGQVLIDDGIGLFGQDWVYHVGAGVTEVYSGGMVILKGTKEHEPKSVLGVEKTSRELIRLERRPSRRSPPVTSRYRGDRRWGRVGAVAGGPTCVSSFVWTCRLVGAWCPWWSRGAW